MTGRGLTRRRYWGNEPMAAAGNRLYIKRTICLIAERVADLFDREIDGLIEVHKGAVGPQLAADFFARDQRAGLPDQKNEELERLRLEFQPSVFAPKFRRINIEFELAKAEHFL